MQGLKVMIAGVVAVADCHCKDHQLQRGGVGITMQAAMPGVQTVAVGSLAEW